MQLILASTSPRRRELLSLLKIPFELREPSFVEEFQHGRSPLEQVKAFALGKAQSVAVQEPDAIILGSDTIIELDGDVLGKPADLLDAAAMLRRLAGRDHAVYSAVAAVHSSRHIELVDLSTAVVRMKPFDQQEHERYLATGESLGKAGAYSIQGAGAALIESLKGDFPTVVGLPLRLVARLLAQSGMAIRVNLDDLYASTPYSNWSRFKAGAH